MQVNIQEFRIRTSENNRRINILQKNINLASKSSGSCLTGWHISFYTKRKRDDSIRIPPGRKKGENQQIEFPNPYR